MKGDKTKGGDSLQEVVNDEISIADLLATVFRFRGWYIISLIFAISLGVLYIRSTPNLYTRQATVLFKDNAVSVMGQAAAYSDLFVNSKNSVYNDIGLFRSRRLMLDVVNRLRLDVNYSRKMGLLIEDLYKISPFDVQFQDITSTQNISFRIRVLSESELLLSDIEVDREVIHGDLNIMVGDRVECSFGTIVINPTLFMNPEFIGEQIIVNRFNPNEVAQLYNDKLNIAMVDRMATLVNLDINDVSIVRADDILNTLIEVYMEDAVGDQSIVLLNTEAFIDERLAIIDAELTAIDAEIELFKKSNKLTDIISESSMYVDNFSRLDSEVLLLDNQLKMAEYMRSYLIDNSKIADLIPANIGVDDSGVQSQIAEYNALMTKRNKLLVNSSAQNPLVIDLQNSLTSMRASIIRSVDNLITALKIKERNYIQKERENNSKIADVPSQQKYIVNIQRQQMIKEELYLYLLNKKEECSLQQSVVESNCRIVDSAFGSSHPIAPRKVVILLICLIIGFLAPSVVIYALSLLNTKVQSRKDVKESLTIPYLGDIPLDKSSAEAADVVVSEGSRTPVNEAFRILRDNIDFANIDGDMSSGRVLQLTSFNPNSGKTFVALNLATSISLSNSKVIVVDLDIRKGTLSKRLGRGFNHLGASQYLSGKVLSIDDVIQKSDSTLNFDVISSGPLPPNPAELLKSGRLATLFDGLRARYDYVIIDNPPFSLVVDAAICSRYCDQSIYILRAGLLDRRVLPDIQELYDQNKLPNMGIILNGTNSKQNDYGYSYGYGGVYGYGGDSSKEGGSISGWLRSFLGF